MRGVVLVGQRGSGKTTLGGLLAQCLGLPFLDSDQEFRRRFGCCPGDWIRNLGEASFRQREEILVCGLLRRLLLVPGVLALGGGAPCSPRTRDALVQLRKGAACVVYLTCPLDQSLLRQEGRGEPQPLLRAGSAREDGMRLFAERHLLYSSSADLQFLNDFEDPVTALRALLPILEPMLRVPSPPSGQGRFEVENHPG